MIAAIEWIPAGRANPNPSKYEYSRAEQEFLARVQAGELDGGGGGDDAEVVDGGAEGGDKFGSDEDWEDVEDDEEEDDKNDREGNTTTGGSSVVLPKIDPSSLPADLRMDEYSDDEEKDVGDLLRLGEDAEMMGATFKHKSTSNTTGEDNDSDDSEDEDDLEDIPDTREYMPLNLEGLQSLGIGGSKMSSTEGYTMEDLRNMTMNNIDLEDSDDEEEDQEDADDIRLQDGDALIVVAKTEDDFASLEINIFDAESSNLYVHHDIPLPSFPLCLALGSVVSSYQPNDENNGVSVGNYVAVGSFEPGIEIWNLDVMNALEPTLVLGGADTRGAEENWMKMQSMMPSSTTIGGKKKKNKGKIGGSVSGRSGGGLREGSHTDAVMGLCWNTVHKQVLASGSADGTVKLWDVTQSSGEYVRPSATLTHHTDKVQSLAWHPSEGTLLATGGYDRKVCLVDARSAAAASSTQSNAVKKAKLLADCEAIAWDPHNQQYLTAACEDGTILCWDVRKFDLDPVWKFVAHEYGGVSDISYNCQVPGMFVTCSIDKTVALWDIHGNSSPQPCGSKDMSVGKLYSVSCYPSSPWLLACGGSGNELAIWDMESEDAIQNRFASRIHIGEGSPAHKQQSEGNEAVDFEAVMATESNSDATLRALENMNKSKKKKAKKSKAHKKR